MGYLALSVALLGTIYFAIHYSRFRRGLLYVLGAAIALGVVAGVVTWYNEVQRDKRRLYASTLIKTNQIEISGAKLSIGLGSKLTGVVTNRSRYDLADLVLKVTVTDCPRISVPDLPPGFVLDKNDPPLKKKKGGPWDQFKDASDTSKCGIVGQKVVRAYPLNVPAGQKRAFNEYVYFSNLPKMKKWSWRYSIEKIVAKH